MITLGIESTAHTLGIGIINDKGKVLANERATFTTERGGIHPTKAYQHHVFFYDTLLKNALTSAKIELEDITLIAFAQGPGLGQNLRVGAVAARALGRILNKPIIGVNHCVAHIEIGKLKTGLKDPITLYTSGANTQIIAYAGTRYRVFGETLDLGVGNFLDTIARFLNLGFPGGPKIEKLAKKGKHYIELPYSIKGMDFSFSGIQTRIRTIIENKKHKKEDICFSTQETIFAMLTEATERAVAHIDKKEVLLTGGVAANRRLVEMLSKMCKDRKIKFAVCPKELAGDNGAMIAWQGLLEYKAGKRQTLNETEISNRWRTDQVDVCWI